MKYTVVIRQPVADDMRQELEKNLMQRFNLSGDQAQRLSARRSGRLMKPTSLVRAELLRNVFESVGAQVMLEEVREETGLLSEPFQSVSRTMPPQYSALDTQDDAPLAPLLASSSQTEDLFRAPAPVWPDETLVSPFGAPSTPVFTPPASSFPFTPTTPSSSTPLPTAPLSSAALGSAFAPAAPKATLSNPTLGNPTLGGASGSLSTTWPDHTSGAAVMDAVDIPPAAPARKTSASDHFALDHDLSSSDSLFVQSPTPQGPPDQSPRVNLLDNLGSAKPKGAPLLGADLNTPEASPTGPLDIHPLPRDPVTTTDVWTDFTGSLSVPESAPRIDPKVTSVTPVLVADVPEAAAAPTTKRNTLARQLTLGTLLPLGLSTIVTLGLLGITLPALQRQSIQESANTLVSVIGTNLTPGSQERSAVQVDSMLRGSNLGFVRVETPSGSYLRSRENTQNDVMDKQLADWVKTHPSQGVINLGGQQYVVSRQSFMTDAAGRVVVAPAKVADAKVAQRVTVGLPSAQATGNLRNTLLLVLGVSLLGLGLAGLLAARAARQVIQPVERLVKVADAISMGDLTRPVQVERNDEIGDLAQALERMRLSLEAAMERLRRRQKRG